MPPSNADYAKINIACKELGIDKYEIIADRYGLTTSKELSPAQVRDLINHFQSKDWKPQKGSGKSKTKKGDFRQIPTGPFSKQQKYICSLWHALGYDMNKLDHRIKKQFKIDRIEWLQDHDKLHIVITDLKQRCWNKGLDPEQYLT